MIDTSKYTKEEVHIHNMAIASFECEFNRELGNATVGEINYSLVKKMQAKASKKASLNYNK